MQGRFHFRTRYNKGLLDVAAQKVRELTRRKNDFIKTIGIVSTGEANL